MFKQIVKDCLVGFDKGKLPPCRYEDKAFLERIKAGRDRFADAMLSLRQECYFQPWAAIEAEGKAWGCDLTYDYVRINGDYRS